MPRCSARPAPGQTGSRYAAAPPLSAPQRPSVAKALTAMVAGPRARTAGPATARAPTATSAMAAEAGVRRAQAMVGNAAVGASLTRAHVAGVVVDAPPRALGNGAAAAASAAPRRRGRPQSAPRPGRRAAPPAAMAACRPTSAGGGPAAAIRDASRALRTAGSPGRPAAETSGKDRGGPAVSHGRRAIAPAASAVYQRARTSKRHRPAMRRSGPHKTPRSIRTPNRRAARPFRP